MKGKIASRKVGMGESANTRRRISPARGFATNFVSSSACQGTKTIFRRIFMVCYTNYIFCNLQNIPSLHDLWYSFVWTNRNAAREDGRGRREEDLVRAIRIYANESAKPQQELRVQQPMTRARWCKPPVGVLKLNCDASFLHESRGRVVGGF